MNARVLISAGAGAERQRAALEWLGRHARDAELLVVAPTLDAGRQLLCTAVQRGGSSFGWHGESLVSLAGKLAALPLARKGLSPLGAFGAEALAARSVFELRTEGQLGRFTDVADRPGLPRALARTFAELAMAGVQADADVSRLDQDLARLLARYRALLEQGALADRARVFAEAARAALESGQAPVGLPLLLWDVRVATPAERALVEALVRRARECLATVPALDARSLQALQEVLATEVRTPRDGAVAGPPATTLQRLQGQLFSVPEHAGELGEDVAILSAPGEARECVEIARRILREAERGVPFDRMAILLRAPELYRVHLIEALRRARVPAHFTRASTRPDPAGRALLALLACAAENLSARRFAEYLSLGVVPRPDAAGAPPAPRAREDVFVQPDDELLALGASALVQAEEVVAAPAANTKPTAAAAPGSLPAPRHWERLLCEAAVLGGKARWRRRLDGLAEQLALELERSARDNDALQGKYARDLEALRSLAAFALPLIDALDALPSQASWREWIDALAALATRAIAEPTAVLRGLAELAPMAAVGPVGLAEVRLVLQRRLGEQLLASPGSLAGKVFVASIDEARGMVFDAVFVTGLAEKIFPPKIGEDPLLLDAERARVSNALPIQTDRVDDERCALQLAVGAARERLIVSYPRFSAEKARPRVPSFYALELLRAAEGTLPGFAAVARRATEAAGARMGWPAPRETADAIDDTEYDLVVLERFLKSQGTDWSGAAHYLLSANAHLSRALRFRARRWHPGWHAADGLVLASQEGPAAAALARHALPQRPYSATELERYAPCPYRFYLAAVVGLSPRDAPAAIETLGGTERGKLVHEVLRLFLTRVRAQGGLAVAAAQRKQTHDLLALTVSEVAERFHERLAPAIERVWDDGVEEIGEDLHEWLERAIEEAWTPEYFELGFGLDRPELDPASRREPVALAGLTLRGAIDLVESKSGQWRAVDYKTGAPPGETVAGIRGGKMLQPILYAHALQQLFPHAAAVSGQAYYCTTRGGFRKVEVALDDAATRCVALVVRTIGDALEQGFLPAAPERGACERCDYAMVCGPYEEQRVEQKRDASRLHPLKRLRSEL
jgi:RecB family exonuclease